eukprot:7214134-Karenia_brevis.AAC.1
MTSRRSNGQQFASSWEQAPPVGRHPSFHLEERNMNENDSETENDGGKASEYLYDQNWVRPRLDQLP